MPSASAVGGTSVRGRAPTHPVRPTPPNRAKTSRFRGGGGASGAVSRGRRLVSPITSPVGDMEEGPTAASPVLSPSQQLQKRNKEEVGGGGAPVGTTRSSKSGKAEGVRAAAGARSVLPPTATSTGRGTQQQQGAAANRLLGLFRRGKNTRLDTRRVMPHKELARDYKDIISVRRDPLTVIRSYDGEEVFLLQLDEGRANQRGASVRTGSNGIGSTMRSGFGGVGATLRGGNTARMRSSLWR